MSYNYTLIIPHYNIPKLLRRLLSTVPKRNDLQVIVVDDCSTKELDELEKVKQEYSWVEWYDTGTNGGGGKARNVGLDHAKGKYLIFADADDYFNLCFEDCLNNYKDSEYDLIFFTANSLDGETYQNCDRDQSITGRVNTFLETRKYNDLLYKFTAPWSKFISNKMVKENNIRFLESPVYNDMHFSLITDYHSTKIHADARAIYCVTSRKNSVSSVSTEDKEVAKMRVVASYYKIARDLQLDIVPLRFLIGPMISVLKKNGWSDGMTRSIEKFQDIGLRPKDLMKEYYKYILYKKFLQPGKKLMKDFIRIFREVE